MLRAQDIQKLMTLKFWFKCAQAHVGKEHEENDVGAIEQGNEDDNEDEEDEDHLESFRSLISFWMWNTNWNFAVEF